jgi:murein L,D-transpeptidase YafK
VFGLRLVFVTLAAFLLGLGRFGAISSAQPRSPEVPAPVADHILVEKAAHRMTLFSAGRPVRAYRVALGQGGLGAKQRQGDKKVPEGRYYITGRNPESDFHLSLRIGYPTLPQAEAAERQGIDPGGDIMIHGLPNGVGPAGARHPETDWTHGCIAVTNAEIEEIWHLVPDWAIIEIRG